MKVLALTIDRMERTAARRALLLYKGEDFFLLASLRTEVLS